MTEETDSRPSAALHEAVIAQVIAAIDIDWETVEAIRDPVLKYLKECEKRDILSSMEIHYVDEEDRETGLDAGAVYLMFAIAEDGEFDEPFRSERYALVDVIADAYQEELTEQYELIAALEKTLEQARQKFAERWSIECTREAVDAKAAVDYAARWGKPA